MAEGHALEVFLDRRDLDQSVVGDAPIGQQATHGGEGGEADLIGVLAGVGGQEGGDQHIG